MKSRHSAFAFAFAAAATLAALQAQASGSLPPSAHRMPDASTSCESSRLSAWFERQRELTDGEVDPQKPIASPAECMRAADAGARERKDASAEVSERDAHASRMWLGPRG
jgi:hypothetical protein